MHLVALGLASAPCTSRAPPRSFFLPLGERCLVRRSRSTGARRPRRLGRLRLRAHLGLGHDLGVAAEQDVGAAAGHVGGDGDRALAAGLRDDVGLALVLLGVEHVVRDALLLEEAWRAPRSWRWRPCPPAPAGPSRAAPRSPRRPPRTSRARSCRPRPPRPCGPSGGWWGRRGRRGCRSCANSSASVSAVPVMPDELRVHAEVVLERDGRERLVLVLDLHAFLGLDRLVQTVGPAAAGHQAAGELVDDHAPRRPSPRSRGRACRACARAGACSTWWRVSISLGLVEVGDARAASAASRCRRR